MVLSDDSPVHQIMATHCPDGKEFNMHPFLGVVENIIHQPTFTNSSIVSNNETGVQPGSLPEDEILQNGFSVMSEELVYIVNRISVEISTKSLAGDDGHLITLEVFKLVPGFTWENKVMIALAAYIVKYSEFWLLAQSRRTSSSQLANSLALLIPLPNMTEHEQDLRLKFEVLTKLVETVVNLTKIMGELKKVPPVDALSTPTLHEAVAAAAYWCIRTIVVCFLVITSNISMGRRYISSSTESWELSSLVNKVSNIHSDLQKQLCERRRIEAYQILCCFIEAPEHPDNIKALGDLIYAKDDQLPLFDGSTKRQARIDVLRRKFVLLLISDLDIFQEELTILDRIYRESHRQYEIVWLPVVDRLGSWNEANKSQFEKIKGLMPWYSVYHPPLLDLAVVNYIKEVWHFNKKTLIVVLDPQGKVVNPNAIHIMWIWGSLAFPFTGQKEEDLWGKEAWRIEFLAGLIEPLVFNWVAEGKNICLYGGEDIEWIRRFTTTARAMSQVAHIPLEMLHVGKTNPREKVRKINATIVAENLSHVLPDLTLIWFFWVRLESMWHSKMQRGRSVENDPIMQEIMTMLSFDASDQGWAVISRGSAEMAKAKGDAILQSLTQFDEWRVRVGEVGFVPALVENLQAFQPPHHCNRLILPGVTGVISDRVVCAECGRPMEKITMYRCCTD